MSKNINENNCVSNVEHFGAVIAHINIKLLDENQAVPMSTLRLKCWLKCLNV